MKRRDEASIAALFSKVAEEFPDVSAGSYPQVVEGHGEIVAISFEAKDDVLLDSVVERYTALLTEHLASEQKQDDCILGVKSNVNTLA